MEGNLLHAMSKLGYTAISRKVVGKNVHATTPKGNMGYDRYTVPNDCSCRTYFCCFPLALEKHAILMPFFQISLEKSADKTTHNTFRDCRVHFLRQPFLKQLYIIPCCLFSSSYILSNIMHSAKIEIRECDKWSLIRG